MVTHAAKLVTTIFIGQDVFTADFKVFCFLNRQFFYFHSCTTGLPCVFYSFNYSIVQTMDFENFKAPQFVDFARLGHDDDDADSDYFGMF